jgi:AmiR/NasT family two-component response regulator
MKIGIVTIDADLKTALLAIIQQFGEQAEEYQQPTQAVAAGVAVVFVQWTAQLRRAALAIFDRGAATNRPAVIALVPPGDVSAMRQARDDGASGVLFAPPDFVEVRAELEAAKKALDSPGSVGNSKLEAVRSTLLGEAQTLYVALRIWSSRPI